MASPPPLRTRDRCGQIERSSRWRNRIAGAASERARSTVRQRLKNAMQQIDSRAPILGDYLRRAVRTGTFCAYLPGIAQVVRWNRE